MDPSMYQIPFQILFFVVFIAILVGDRLCDAFPVSTVQNRCGRSLLSVDEPRSRRSNHQNHHLHTTIFNHRLRLSSIDNLIVAPTIKTTKTRLYMFDLSQSNDDEESAASDLLEKAARLRQEANAMESELREQRPGSIMDASTEAVAVPPQQPKYSTIKDSAWLLTYRFSDQPENSDASNDSSGSTTSTPPQRDFFSGKLTLRFRADGYSDLLDHQVVSMAGKGSDISIAKVWGWDVERSAEDEKDYLIFSLDVDGISSTADSVLSRKSQRFYLQARLLENEEKGKAKSIALEEGTVTIKQDVVQKGVRWGFFAPQGILAQFRYVGDFVAKPHRQ